MFSMIITEVIEYAKSKYDIVNNISSIFVH